MGRVTGGNRVREVGGLFLLALCAVYVLSLISYNPGDILLVQCPVNQPPANLIGPVGAWLGYANFMLFGISGYCLPVCLGAFGFFMLLKHPEERLWPKIIWIFLALLSLSCLSELNPIFWSATVDRLNIGFPGGLMGSMFGRLFLIRYLGETGTAILALVILLAAIVLLFEIRPTELAKGTGRRLAGLVSKIYGRSLASLGQFRSRQAEIEREEKILAKDRRRLERIAQREVPAKETFHEEAETRDAEIKDDEETMSTVQEEPPVVKPVVSRILRRKPKKSSLDETLRNLPTPSLPISTNFKLPPLSLLDDPPPGADRVIRDDFQSSSRILEETLAEFGIEAKVTNYETGPVVTSYEVLPAPGVRVERISGLSNNIALSMKAISVRVQAPIPGKGVVGIEVPNSKSTLVYLREILEGKRWTSGKAALPLALGKDVGGNDIVADLAKMPHMLIAGATGSGKSVCINSILAGLLMSRTPDQLRLMLVDPKIVEFSFFNNLPHLVVPVITDPKKVNLGLRWAIQEMEKRYKLFASVGVRNIESYNDRPITPPLPFTGKDAELAAPIAGRSDQPPDRLPYIVIVIDELADLMIVAQAEIENSITRLAQLSRAVGIHMIIATQRPSVNVITGTIKANFPARLAFQVAQKVDSRTILDANGADKLLGKGDMLLLPPGIGKLVRAQGTMTTDREIREIVEFWKQQGPPRYEVAIKEKMESTATELSTDSEVDDEMLEMSIEVIRQTKRASTSSLQRRLRIGYTRAARIMDILEERGIVGPPRGSDPREILIDLDGDIPAHPAGLREDE